MISKFVSQKQCKIVISIIQILKFVNLHQIYRSVIIFYILNRINITFPFLGVLFSFRINNKYFYSLLTDIRDSQYVLSLI